MKILALETATEACSVALLTERGMVERFELAPRRHAELALPMADAVLAEAGVRRSQLDAIAFGRGPGAFTGVRLAVSIAQGLSLGLERPLVPVSTLAALALDAAAATAAATSNDVSSILAVIDARMGEIYACAFDRDADGLVTAAAEEWVGPAEALDVPPRRAWVVCGSGWGAWEGVRRTRLTVEPRAALPELLPHAASVARLALRELRAGRGLDAANALPVYLRDKVALTIAEQRDRG